MLSIEAPDASGDPKSIWDGYAALGWRHDPNPEPKVIGYRAECDLCYILRDPLEVRFSPLIKGQIPERFTEPFQKFVFTLQARGIEADSRLRRVEISWNGKWSDDKDEMKNYLVVKEV